MAGDRPREELLREAERQASRMTHRGPDAESSRLLDGCALAHTRLRILDTSELADQPMAGCTPEVQLVYNGEIYNFPELRRELEAKGHHLRSRSDTDVLVHLYEEEGEDLVHRLRGMFAFALWDGRRRSLLVARDRLGIKPLYYALERDGAIRFASEVRALTRRGDRVDEAALAAYARMGWVPDPRTIVSGILSLPPGHRLTWHEGHIHLSRWWRAPLDMGTVPLTPAHLHEVLEDALERHLAADVPVGLFLSSGVDSAALAALAAKKERSLRTFTVSFGGTADESENAGRIATHYGLPHTIVPVDGAELLQRIDRVVGALDQPSVDGVNTWVVARAVRAAGAVVALSGLGGDELFQGYSTFRRVPQLVAAAQRLSLLPSGVRAVPLQIMGRWPARMHRRGARVLEAMVDGGPWSAYLSMRAITSAAQLAWLWPDSGRVDGIGDDSAAGREVVGLELENYLPYQLLRDADAMSMAHSLELRVPLLDDRVVVAALGMQSNGPGPRGKDLLIEAVDPCLRTFLGKRKQTFTLPFDRWLHVDLAEWTRESLISLSSLPLGFERQRLEALWSAFQAGRASWRTLWGLSVLSRWLTLQLSDGTAPTASFG